MYWILGIYAALALFFGDRVLGELSRIRNAVEKIAFPDAQHRDEVQRLRNAVEKIARHVPDERESDEDRV
jgi:hypothetical protein